MRFLHYMLLHIIMQLSTSSGSLKLATNFGEVWDVLNFITSKEPRLVFQDKVTFSQLEFLSR